MFTSPATERKNTYQTSGTDISGISDNQRVSQDTAHYYEIRIDNLVSQLAEQKEINEGTQDLLKQSKSQVH